MALPNVELYEALKSSVGEDAARMIAEVVPPATDLATKQDLRAETTELRGEMREGFAQLRGEMREGFATLRAEMNAGQVNTMRWMLGFFIPVWAGTWATVVAVIVKL